MERKYGVGKRARRVAAVVAAAVFAWGGTRSCASAQGKDKDMPMLNWMGREKAVRADKDVALRILREDRELECLSHAEAQSKGGAASAAQGRSDFSRARAEGTCAAKAAPPLFDNLLVHGDNLEALKALLPFYAGEVKCIYIDPPYNTGSAFEHYDDNLEHATWLNMMYPRLKLLRDFLREDGSIWISIDDREGAYLRVVCDEIFGRQNFVSNISWQRTYSTRNDAKGIVNEVEHILVYSKREGWQPKKLARTEEMDKRYKNPDNDVCEWKSGDAFAPGAATHQGMVYAIQNPFSGDLIYPYDGACWRYEQETMLEIMNGWCPYELREIDDAEKRAAVCGVGVDEVRKGVKAIVLTGGSQFIATENNTDAINCVPPESRKLAQAVLKRGQWPKFYFTKNGKGGIARKVYLSAVGDVPPTNLFEYKDVGHTDEAKKEVLKVFDGASPFATPKPERLVKRILEIATDEGDLVLDSFLGSGTTAAVAHKMRRRWIGIEMGEHAKTHCAVRMRKVVEGEQGGISKAVGWQGGGGFRFCELGERLLDEKGQLSASIPYDVLAAHIWWQETGRGWNGSRRGAEEAEAQSNSQNLCDSANSAPLREKKSTVLGIHKGTAYSLLYNGILHDRSVNGGNVLTRATLGVIKEDLGGAEYERLVIYGEACRLGDARLKDEKIEFRQTPYDVVTRR